MKSGWLRITNHGLQPTHHIPFSSFIMEGLLTMLLSDRFSALANDTTQSKRSPEAEALREPICKDMEKKK